MYFILPFTSKTGKSAYTSSYPFSGKLFCHSCGSKYTRRTSGTGKYRIITWMCINHMQNGNEACTMQAIHERAVEKAFVRAMNEVVAGKNNFTNRLLANIEKGLATTTYVLTMEQIDEKLSELQKELMTLVRVNARTGLDTQVYSKEYLKLSAELDTYRERRQKLKEQEAGRVLQLDRIKELKEYLQGTNTSVDKFDGELALSKVNI